MNFDEGTYLKQHLRVPRCKVLRALLVRRKDGEQDGMSRFERVAIRRILEVTEKILRISELFWREDRGGARLTDDNNAVPTARRTCRPTPSSDAQPH